MIMLFVGLVVLLVVPPTVWWSVTHVVPRVLESMGLLGKAELQAQEARLARMEEAIDALVLQVDQLSQSQRAIAPAQREQMERNPELR